MTHQNDNIKKEFAGLNRVAWERVAGKYQLDMDNDIDFLRRGGTSLHEHEKRLLGDLSDCKRAIQLQCSHGQDALSLLNLGVKEVIGVDISEAALAIAAEKSERLAASASWICADVLETPDSLNGTADLIYTGQGALPWVLDIERWASVIARLLRPGGRFFIYEGHPLNWTWDENAAGHVPVQGGYFDAKPRPNEGFPASAIARYTPEDEAVPIAWERNWTLGEIVSSLSGAGLQIQCLEEYPEHFWPQFSNIPDNEMALLPHSFALLARSSTT